jgi:hypothetical protein
MRRKLFVDFGHSAKWPGAVGIKKETDWNRAIYRQLGLSLCLAEMKERGIEITNPKTN